MSNLTSISKNPLIAKILSDNDGNLYICGSFTISTPTTTINNLAVYNINSGVWSGVGDYYP